MADIYAYIYFTLKDSIRKSSNLQITLMVNFSMKYSQYFCCAKICYMRVAANNDVSTGSKEGYFPF